MKNNITTLTSTVLLALSCVPTAHIVTYEELAEGICRESRKNCVDFKETGHLYYVSDGEVFRHYRGVDWAEPITSPNVHEIVGYRGTIVALRSNGDVHILYPKNPSEEREGDSWIQIGEMTMSLEADDNSLFTLKATGDVWTFSDASEESVVFVSKTEYIRKPIVYHAPTVAGQEIEFEPTAFTDITSLDKNVLGQVVGIDEDSVSSILFAFAAEPPNEQL